MGMYTELIFGASLKKNTPKLIIDSIRYILGEVENAPEGFPFEKGRGHWLLTGSSYYFGVSNNVNKFWFDSIGENYILSARCSIKNYGDEIEEFLRWIKPYIESGSGCRDMYAITIYEESAEPIIHYLH